VGPTIGPTDFEKKKTLVSTGIRNPDGPVCNLVSIPNTAVCKTQKRELDLTKDRLLHGSQSHTSYKPYTLEETSFNYF
jgi:hypothetical protein